jgi:hypothetical protein
MWPSLAMLTAAGVSGIYRWLPFKGLRLGLLVTAAAGQIYLYGQGQSLQDEYPGQFREAFDIMRREAEPGDVLLLQDGTLFTAAEYYHSPLPYVGIPPDKLTNVERQVEFHEALDGLNSLLKSETRHIWVLAWQGDVMDPMGLAFALPEYLSDGRRTVWLGSPNDRRANQTMLIRYEVSDEKQPIFDHIVAYPGVLQVLPDGPSLLGYEVYTVFGQSRDPGVDCSIIVHSWWWRGQTDDPNAAVSVSLVDDNGQRLIQRDQPPAGFHFGQEKWTPFVPTLGRVDLAFPCAWLQSGATYAVWLTVYDMRGEKPAQPVLARTFAAP